MYAYQRHSVKSKVYKGQQSQDVIDEAVSPSEEWEPKNDSLIETTGGQKNI